MQCNGCDRRFQDGDTAYEVGVIRIKVVGKRATFDRESNVYVCEDCHAKEKH